MHQCISNLAWAAEFEAGFPSSREAAALPTTQRCPPCCSGQDVLKMKAHLPRVVSTAGLGLHAQHWGKHGLPSETRLEGNEVLGEGSTSREQQLK